MPETVPEAIARIGTEAEHALLEDHRRAIREARESTLVIAILVRKLGGTVVITDEEVLNAGRGVLISHPEPGAYRLTVRDESIVNELNQQR